MAIRQIDVHTLKSWLDAGEPVALIDVRERDEWDEAHLAAAVLNPLSAFDASAVPAAADKLVFMCRSGRRSESLSRRLRAAGGPAAMTLAGGLLDWIAAGYPVES